MVLSLGVGFGRSDDEFDPPVPASDVAIGSDVFRSIDGDDVFSWPIFRSLHVDKVGVSDCLR